MGGVLAVAADTPSWVTAAAVAAAAVWSAWRERNVKKALADKETRLRELMQDEIAVFQAGNQELRNQIIDAEHRYENAHHKCQLEVAELRGEVSMLRSDFAADIAGQVVAAVVDAVNAAVHGDRRQLAPLDRDIK